MKIFCSSTDISRLERQGVVCAHMPGFHRPGHILFCNQWKREERALYGKFMHSGMKL